MVVRLQEEGELQIRGAQRAFAGWLFIVAILTAIYIGNSEWYQDASWHACLLLYVYFVLATVPVFVLTKFAVDRRATHAGIRINQARTPLSIAASMVIAAILIQAAIFTAMFAEQAPRRGLHCSPNDMDCWKSWADYLIEVSAYVGANAILFMAVGASVVFVRNKLYEVRGRRDDASVSTPPPAAP